MTDQDWRTLEKTVISAVKNGITESMKEQIKHAVKEELSTAIPCQGRPPCGFNESEQGEMRRFVSSFRDPEIGGVGGAIDNMRHVSSMRKWFNRTAMTIGTSIIVAIIMGLGGVLWWAAKTFFGATNG